MAEGNTRLVGMLVGGIGFLILIAITIFIVLDTIGDAKLLRGESETATDGNTTINATCCQLTNWNAGYKDWEISSVIGTLTGTTITSPNYTLNTNTGAVRNATDDTAMTQVNITYSYDIPSDYEMTYDAAGGNFTDGVDNVSGKIPTILLIGIMVVLFGLLAFLITRTKQLGFAKTSGSL